MTRQTRRKSSGMEVFLPWMPTANGGENRADDINAFYGNMMRAGQEFSELCTRRGRAYMDLPRVLCECQHPDDIIKAETEFWNEAYHQYKEYVEHSMSGPMAVMSGMIEGQRNGNAKKAASDPVQKRKSAKRGKSTRASAKRRSTGNGNAFYTYPENVSERSEGSGRIH